MRTTLPIDDDVLAAAKGLAALQHKSVGEVISELTRQALRPNVRLAMPVRQEFRGAAIVLEERGVLKERAISAAR